MLLWIGQGELYIHSMKKTKRTRLKQPSNPKPKDQPNPVNTRNDDKFTLLCMVMGLVVGLIVYWLGL
jgi:hypothetical protein